MALILVLDDLSDNRDLLVAVLSSADHRVLQAANGQEALALTRAENPDLIIADILMPGMDGYEFVRALRNDPQTADARVVLCTATYGDDEVRRLAEACGVEHLMIKPLAPEEILEVVDVALASGPYTPTEAPGGGTEFKRDHLSLVNDKLLQKVAELEHLNKEHARLEEELREAERATAESLTVLEALQSTAPVGFIFVDRELRIRRINAALAEANGAPAADQIGRLVAEVVPGLWRQLEPRYRHVLNTGEALVNEEIRLKLPGAAERSRVFLSTFYPVSLRDEVIGVSVVAVDISQRQVDEEFRQAVMDSMAEGLYVIDAQDRLTFMNAAAERMLGYSLEELAGRPMHETIHYQHVDGSAFPAEECELLRVRVEGRPIRKSEDAFTRKDGTILPTAYAAAPLGGTADSHGAVVVFRDTTEERAEQTRVQRELNSLTWIGRIREALDEDRMVLFSQPIVPLCGAHQSMELLVRMIGRDGELVPPGSFLPVAEKYGLIREIDQRVITEAIQIAARGHHLHVNISAESIGSVDLLSFIEQLLDDHQPDPSNLVFEITETALTGDIEAGEAFARGLTDLGCALALDDFGTGYGSFTYLKRLPITYLKIDMEFVHDLPSSPGNQHLVRAIVNIAKGFGQQTIAEGIEDAETLALVRDYDVDFGQGFYLGRPAAMTKA